MNAQLKVPPKFLLGKVMLVNLGLFATRPRAIQLPLVFKDDKSRLVLELKVSAPV